MALSVLELQSLQTSTPISHQQVDLAGSERLAKSGVSGDRQKEAPELNRPSMQLDGRWMLMLIMI